MANLEHKNIADPNIHEPKGAATAAVGSVYESDGAGSGAWTIPNLPLTGTISQGVYDYNDVTTTGTPIPLTVAGTPYELTNDGAGAFTNTTYALNGLTEVWDVATDQFVWTDGTVLALGDTVDIRLDIDVIVTGTNKAVKVDIELGIGASPYSIPIMPLTNYKAADTYHEVRLMSIYMGDTNTLNNPGKLKATADGTGVTVVVNGWYVRVLHTNA